MPPFSNIRNQKKLLDSILKTAVPEIPERWSEDFKDFIKLCMKRDPDERWTIAQLLDHSFL